MDAICKKQIKACEMALMQGFSGDFPLAENVLFGGGVVGKPCILFVQLFEETHPQPFGAVFSVRGCVEGKMDFEIV